MLNARAGIAAICLMACGGQEAAGAARVEEPHAPGATSATGTSVIVPGAPDLVAQALAGAHRGEANRARDVYRHPHDTLAFFGLEPAQRVIELWPGGGWYTEVLAPVLRERGRLIATVPELAVPAYRELLATHPDIYDRVQVQTLNPPQSLQLGTDGSADLVLTFCNVHNWLSGGFASELHSAIFRVLEPGGVYGVVEHRAKPDTTLESMNKTGYVTEAKVIQLATQAGLVLEARSEINANPRDTKDYPEGVWSLPPVLRLDAADRDKYLAIGESDRMTLRFRKPGP